LKFDRNQHTTKADPRSHGVNKKDIDKQNCLQLPDGRLQRISAASSQRSPCFFDDTGTLKLEKDCWLLRPMAVEKELHTIC